MLPSKACRTAEDLTLAYTPGVAEPCLCIQADPSDAYLYTGKGNSVAVVTDGTAVLGLGNLGAIAAKPVMEGKAILFKRFADIDAVDVEVQCPPGVDLVDVVQAIAPTYGGINLEDIRAPQCFGIEASLKERLDIPVFHDDQHGTAVVVAAGLLNALALAGKGLSDVRIVMNGAGAAATATIRFLRTLGVQPDQAVVCDTKGVLHSGRDFADAPHKADLAQTIEARTLEEAIVGADVFIGVSSAGALTPEMLRSMAPRPIVFALANPEPEITYGLAREVCPEAMIATGRSDMPNQVNNVLAFPYLFRAALDVRATRIDDAMMRAAAEGLAELARDGAPTPFGQDSFIPNPFDERLFSEIPTLVADAAMRSGAAQRSLDLEVYRAALRERQRRLLAQLRTCESDAPVSGLTPV